MNAVDSKIQNALNEICKLVGIPVRLGAWNLKQDGALDCVGMAIEYARIVGQPISWEMFQHPGNENYESHWYEDPNWGVGDQFENFKSTVGREVSFLEKQAGDVIVVQLRGLPHIGVFLGYGKWIYPAGPKGISIGRFNDFWHRRLMCILRPHVFEKR